MFKIPRERGGVKGDKKEGGAGPISKKSGSWGNIEVQECRGLFPKAFCWRRGDAERIEKECGTD